MDTRVLLVLFIISLCWCCSARDLETANHVTGGWAIILKNLCSLTYIFGLKLNSNHPPHILYAVDKIDIQLNFIEIVRSRKNRKEAMEVSRFNLFFHLFILTSIFSICKSDDPDCVYTVYIRTGSIIRGGTDSIISLTLYDADGYGIRINNLESWGGLMGPDYNYFERGNLDIFSGRGPCLTGPVCAMNLTSDGSGPHHGWYVNYVEVTTTGVHKQCAQEEFTVEQWLATDTSPHELTAIRDYCSSADQKPLIGGSGSSTLSVM